MNDVSHALNIIFNQSSDIILVVNSSGRIIDANMSAANRLNYTREELMDRHILELYPPHRRNDIIEASDLPSGNPSDHRITPLMTKDGRLLPVETLLTPCVWQGEEAFMGVCKELYNIKDKRIEKDIRENMDMELYQHRQYSKILLNMVPSAVFSVNKNKIITSWNKRAEYITGYSSEEVIGKRCDIFANEPCKERCGLFSEDVRKPFVNKVCKIRCKNGEMRILSKSCDIIRNERGEITGGIECFEDITERNIAMEELNKKERILTAVAMSIRELLYNNDYYSAAAKCFSMLGEATDVNRVYLFQNIYYDSNSYKISQKIEWKSEGSSIAVNNPALQDISLEDIPILFEPLERGEALFGITDEIEDQQTREYFLRNGILSVIILPVFVRETFWGFVGFDDCKSGRKWTNTEFSTLSAFTSAFEKAIERSLTENELEVSRQAAETASVLKSQFLANMSHEIRTPMNAIMGFIDLLSRTGLNRMQEDYLREIRTASDTLLLLINDILDYSKIEANKMELEKVPFDFRSLVEDAVALFAPKAYGKGLEISSYIAPDIPEILRGDPVRLQQVLYNLIGNALKFTNEGEVHVSLTVLEKNKESVMMELQVRDTGIGMSEEVQSRLFQIFSQADASTTRKYGGSGLGLAISQRIVQLMGGEINVSSRPDSGSVFFVRITLDYDGEQAGNIDLPKDINLTVLIADASVTNKFVLRSYLQTFGCRILEAGSLEQVVEFINNEKSLDLLIIDYGLLKDTDSDAGSMLSGYVQNGFPFIFITAYDAHIVSSYFSAGFYEGIIKKPVKKKELLETLGFIPHLINPFTNLNADETESEEIKAKRKNIRVLLAEDIAANRRLAAALLEKMGYSPDFAENGYEALQMSMKNNYDLILMDCQMPVMDGYEASTRIKKIKNKKSVIIAMTANSMKGDREKCLASGMDDYISKPITLNNLKAVMKKWLEN